ncbi:MAG: ice-binding family protein [Gammaproteobacteria bacterium]|nr:ice-binding family protein [Gammaproteobacteria bacterium]
MNIFQSSLNRLARLLVLPLLSLTLLMNTAAAAPAASFSAAASGTTSRLSLTVTVNVADADVGLNGNYYLGYQHKGAWAFLTQQGWVPYSSGTVPVYANGPLASATGQVISNADLSALVGAQVYLGYGRTQTDMINNGKNALVYTVPADPVILPPAGPSPVLLGTSANYAVLAKSSVSTVPPSAITGNVAVSPAATSFLTGFSLTMVGTTSATSPQVTGNLYGADMTAPTSTSLTTAVLDMQTAYTDAAGRPTPDFLNLGAGNLGGKTLTGGLYNWGSSVTVPADIAISGGANDVWIFQISGDLNVSPNARVLLEGGAQAKNIFWQVSGEVIINAGAHFEGNILSQTAITLRTGSSLNGRALAQTMVALDATTVVKPAP